MDCCAREAIAAPWVSKTGPGTRRFCPFASQKLCIFSILAATALDKPAVVNTSRSIQRAEAVSFRYRVKPPSRLPLRFIRLKVKLQFVSDDAGDVSQKN